MRFIRASKVRIGDTIRFGDTRLVVKAIDSWNGTRLTVNQSLPPVILFRDDCNSISLEPRDRCELIERSVT